LRNGSLKCHFGWNGRRVSPSRVGIRTSPAIPVAHLGSQVLRKQPKSHQLAGREDCVPKGHCEISAARQCRDDAVRKGRVP
jgi:hypothetical protein